MLDKHRNRLTMLDKHRHAENELWKKQYKNNSTITVQLSFCTFYKPLD
jgi:hypothetical protein